MKRFTILLSSILFVVNFCSAQVVTIIPDPLSVNLPCGDSVIQNIIIENTGVNTLNITGGVIGGGGINDTSTILYTQSPGATTLHNFNIINSGIDTLFITAAVNGDYDQTGEEAEVFVDGISIGMVATGNITLGVWDSVTFAVTGSVLSTILSNSNIDVSIVNSNDVHTNVGAGMDLHKVRVFTKGEGWLSGEIPVTSINPGNTIQIPVTFYSYGLYQGIYNSTITIESNDPGSPYLLPVTLNLNGTAELVLSESCINYGSILQNATKRDTIIVNNSGCDTLKFSGAMSNSDFSYTILDSSLLPGSQSMIIIDFTPSSIGNISGDLMLTTNIGDTTICLSGIGLVAPIVMVTPSPMIVNLDCGDTLIQNFTIENAGGSILNIIGGVIGGGGINDTSTILYTQNPGATTLHNFNIINSGIDTLFITAAVNGDYDQTGEEAEVFVDGISLGMVGTGSITLGVWDSVTFAITGTMLSTILSNGNIDVSIVNSNDVHTNVGAGMDLHKVRVFTKGEGWLSGDIPVVSILPGNTTQVPVTFYSYGLNKGIYNSTITIESNDPGSPYLLPVTLNLSGDAKIGLSQICLDFDSIIVNEYQNDILEIYNTGCDTINLTNILSNNGAYIVDSISTLQIMPGITSYVYVSFIPTTIGANIGTLTIQSNLPDTTICFTGTGLSVISDFSISTQNTCSGVVSFLDSSRGTPTSWVWNFDDGTTSNLQNPDHYFKSIGTYNVELISCNSAGCDTTTQQVVISFTIDEEILSIGTMEVNSSIDFSITGGSNILSILWSFGDGSNVVPAPTTSYKYSSNGTYVVSAKIGKSNGCLIYLYDTLTIGGVGFAENIDNLFSIFPNPVKNSINVLVSKPLNDSRIQLVNLFGKVVYEVKTNLEISGIKIDVQDYIKGSYFLKITTKEGSQYTHKIIIE